MAYVPMRPDVNRKDETRDEEDDDDEPSKDEDVIEEAEEIANGDEEVLQV